MAPASRTALFAKIFKVLKKCYKPASVNADRTVMEHLLFACCLEDAHGETAEEAFAAMVHTFFDWNEVRVTSISELSEVLVSLPDPRAAANRVKRILHAVFEATFNFDLEEKRKKNLGPTITWLEKLDGATRFAVAYVVQAALGGHSIPIDAGAMAVLRALDAVSEKDAAAGVVPGLERAIAKSKGIEFGALLHELGADYSANPYASTVRAILAQIDPEVESRLPKRRVERPAPQPSHAGSPKAPREKPLKASSGKHPAERPPTAAEKTAGKGKDPSQDQPPMVRAADKLRKRPAASSTPAETTDERSRRTESSRRKPPPESLSKRKPR
jgi:endonuclease III